MSTAIFRSLLKSQQILSFKIIGIRNLRFLNTSPRILANKKPASSSKDQPNQTKKISSLDNSISSFLSLPKDSHPLLKNELTEWKTIYKFSHIRTARVIQRFKLYQTAFTCFFAVPGTLGCYLHDLVGIDVVTMTSATCVLACTMLYIMGSFFSRLIGFIYVSEMEPDLVRIAHLTFWGSRQDDVYKKIEFIPFSELPDNLQDVYIHVKTYDDPDNKLYLSLKYGKILDRVLFEDIFGHVPGLVR